MGGSIQRRDFVKAAALAGLRPWGTCPIRVACVGSREFAPEIARSRAFFSAADYGHVLSDPLIDGVCIATAEDERAAMTVAACEAGKDVYVDLPVSLSVKDGLRMLSAARRNERIVQTGNVNRSGRRYQRVRDVVISGVLGKVGFCRISRVESLDLVAFALGDPRLLSVTAQRGPATRLVTFRYADFVVCEEGPETTSFHGSLATLTLDRAGCRIFPNGAEPMTLPDEGEPAGAISQRHWDNWLECIRTRALPVADIGACVQTQLARVQAAI